MNIHPKYFPYLTIPERLFVEFVNDAAITRRESQKKLYLKCLEFEELLKTFLYNKITDHFEYIINYEYRTFFYAYMSSDREYSLKFYINYGSVILEPVIQYRSVDYGDYKTDNTKIYTEFYKKLK